MPESPKIEVGALNISASPHPDGVYEAALRIVANREVSLGGSDWAKITEPGPFEDNPGLLYGQILVWTQIDTEGRWINKRQNREATAAEKLQIEEALPQDLEPNFRAFNFIFVVQKHRLVLEYRNELGDRFGPRRAERLFSNLLSSRYLPENASDFSVTIIPEDDLVEKIFRIPRLRWLEIFVKRPNADDLGDEAARIHKALAKLGAQSQKIEFIKAPKIKSLLPTAKVRRLADIAAIDGYVSGGGKDADGKSIAEFTEKHPKTRTLSVEGLSSFAAFLSSLRHF